MIQQKRIKRYIRQVLAFVEKDFFLTIRVRSNFINRFLSPFIQLMLFYFLLGMVFGSRGGYTVGYWKNNNYILFLFLAFCVNLSQNLNQRYFSLLSTEKYWKTLSAIMIAPINRYTLLLSVIISELVMDSFALIFILILSIIMFPIPIFYLFLAILVYFSIILTFSSIGLIIGVFGISNEEYVQYAFLILRILLLFSCLNFPIEIIPQFLRIFVYLNPFYYYFDLLRLVWYLGINYNDAIKLISPIHIFIVIFMTLTTPIISVYLFEKIYKKYGIRGY